MERRYSPGTAVPREAAFMKQIGQRLQLLMTPGYPKKKYLQAEHWLFIIKKEVVINILTL